MGVGRGRILVANDAMKDGELMFSELPFVWCESIQHNDKGIKGLMSCTECGRFCIEGDKGFECELCSAHYCSSSCKQTAFNSHHQVLCKTANVSILEYEKQTPMISGYLGCAAKVIAMIILDALPLKESDSSSVCDINEIEMQMAVQRVIGGFALLPFTKAIHSFRGGRPMPDHMFTEMFQTNYFEGYLNSAYITLTTIIFTLESYPADSAFRRICLSTPFFDSLMGMFLTNNQCVDISQIGNERHLLGTALYSKYAMANHSCISNWSRSPYIIQSADSVGSEESYERVGNVMYAKGVLSAGEEIFNCYLAQPTGMLKRDRRKALNQYLFVCQCQTCEGEESLSSGEESDE